MFFEIIKLIIYCALIVLISKYLLVKLLRKLAENLNLTPNAVGDVTGYATSIPELLTVCTSSINGLNSISIVNILSSNIINVIQYLISIVKNRNIKYLKNKGTIINLVMIIMTIIIPIIILINNIELNIFIVPIFLIIYIIFKYLNNNAEKLFLKKEYEKLDKIIEKEQKWERGNKSKTIKYFSFLIIIGIALFFIANELGDILLILKEQFSISEIFMGVMLGFITSIPELITFLESQKHYKNNAKNESLGVIEATNNLFTSNILNLFIINSIGIVIYVLLN